MADLDAEDVPEAECDPQACQAGNQRQKVVLPPGADHPVLGVGPAVFPDYYQQYAARIGLETHDSVKHGKRQGELAQRQSHNMFLSIAADVGLLGLLAFVSVIGSTLWTLARARRRWLAARPDLSALATGCMLALIAYLITGLFLTLAYERYFWLLIALSGAAGTLATRGEETREPAA